MQFLDDRHTYTLISGYANPNRVLFFDYIIEDKVFENSKSQCYRSYIDGICTQYTGCRTNSEQISRPAAGRIDTAKKLSQKPAVLAM